MVRPEPCVLFSQTIVHSLLDEWVDEVVFAEPVVITACEFLELNAAPSTQTVSLVGATSPPSFALEIFVYCEGEARFRRLCQPFLYSHSSSNVLEVEAIVTNHMLLRGTYRSLSLVVFGNTAEDLGQYNIELDLDNSLANVTSSPLVGRLEDLPPALRSSRLTFEKSLLSLKFSSFQVTELDLSNEVKRFLLIVLQICRIADDETIVLTILGPFIATACKYAATSIDNLMHSCDQAKGSGCFIGNTDAHELQHILSESSAQMLEIWKSHQHLTESCPSDLDSILTQEFELPETKSLVDMFFNCFPWLRGASTIQESTYLDKSLYLLLGLVLILVSSVESCFCFVDSGGMDQLVYMFSQEAPYSVATTLLLLSIVERSTRYAIGCEAFLGWWQRGDDITLSQSSEGYKFLLKVLLDAERHDIAVFATHILQRLRLYEILSRYEHAVVTLLAQVPVDGQLSNEEVALLHAASTELSEFLNLINLCEMIEDPSPASSVQKLLRSNNFDGVLSYKATSDIFAASKTKFARVDFDLYFLSLQKDKGFFVLSAAFLSSPALVSAHANAPDISTEIMSSLESILLSLLFSRSGLSFLLSQPEVCELLVLSLRGVGEPSRTESISLRQATTLLSKGFFCPAHEVAKILELHLKVGSCINRLLAAAPNSNDSDELLWVLWDISSIARSDSGRQAVLTLAYFPDAISTLLDSLSSYKDLDSTGTTTGGSPLGLAIFHLASEILEVLVTDSAITSLKSWISLAVELQRALHSSSPGSNRKDAPTRLLEWIDAGVVYQQSGALGLLRYAAYLASGGDAHLSSTNVLEPDTGDLENAQNSSVSQVVDNLLEKLVSDKYFDGVVLQSTSIAQLTTAFRILMFISDDSAVVASLFEEGAVNIVYVVLVNCKSMLERLSNSYDYLVDEGAELRSTTDLLLEQCHEQTVIDLMIPALVLLIKLLHKLHDTKEVYRNKKLLNALIRLHCQSSLKLVASTAELSTVYPSSALGFRTICHLATSALACWPVFGWGPGLFHSLLENVQTTVSSLAMGPKDACGIFCLLGDLFPDEDIWLWKNEIPPFSLMRALGTGTLLGPSLEGVANWYLHPEHQKVIMMRLTSKLDSDRNERIIDRVALVVQSFATSAFFMFQDIIRVFIVRAALEKKDCAAVLLRPLFSWLNDKVNDISLSAMDFYKVYHLLHFIASLSEHTKLKVLLCEMGAISVLGKIMEKCQSHLAESPNIEIRVQAKSTNLLSWMVPVFKSTALICGGCQQSLDQMQIVDELSNEVVNPQKIFSLLFHLLELLKVLPVGRELLACALAFKELVLSQMCRSSLALHVSDILPPNQDDMELDDKVTVNYLNVFNWRQSPPLLHCWKRLLKPLNSHDRSLDFVVETIYAVALAALSLAAEVTNPDGITILKFLFGFCYDPKSSEESSDERMNEIQHLEKEFEDELGQDNNDIATFIGKNTFEEVKQAVRALFSLLQANDVSSYSGKPPLAGLEPPGHAVCSIAFASKLLPSVAPEKVNDDPALFSFNSWNMIAAAEKDSSETNARGFPDKLVWELPDSSLDKQPGSSSKRRLASGEASVKRPRDNQPSEATGQLNRGSSLPSSSAGPTRRDFFRQRKPNTSRPPSVHVDDYVARERNIDGASSGPNAPLPPQRGSLSGRPPSIHVDEFIARQRDRQNNFSPGTVAVANEVKSPAVFDNSGSDSAKRQKVQPTKAPIDDDQEINIVFDEGSGSDEKLPFPQPDDSLHSPTVIIGENSPDRMADEMDGNHNLRNPFPQRGSDSVKNSQSNPRYDNAPAMSMAQEVNRPSFRVQPEGLKDLSTMSGPRGTDVGYNPGTTYSASLPAPNVYQRNVPQFSDSPLSSGPHAHGGQRIPDNQALPQMPTNLLPPVSAQNFQMVHSSSFGREAHIHSSSGFRAQSFDSVASSSNAFATSNLMGRGLLDSFASPGSSRPMPPLPPSMSASASHLNATNAGSPSSSLYKNSAAVGVQPSPQLFGDAILAMNSMQGGNLNPQFAPFPPQYLMNRPPSLSGSIFVPSIQPGQIPSVLPLQQSAVASMQAKPPPPPPPQLPHPSQILQQSGSVQAPRPPYEQDFSSFPGNPPQGQVLMPFSQPMPATPMQFFYQNQAESSSSRPPQQSANDQNPSPNQTVSADLLGDPGLSLQQHFSTPEAIQALLSDREKLCQLLEQHPRLMQMLQDRLGQL